MKTNRVPRSGVTFFEILILLAILLFLAALLIPALFSVRVASSRTISLNNLRQIVLATHNFHDAFNRLPPTVGTMNNNEGSALFHILPFIEQDNVFRAAGGKVWQNNSQSTIIPTYLDPSDPTAPPGNLYKGWLATTNYAANYMVLKNGGVTFGNIADGTSNTLLFTTRYQMCNGMPNAWGYPTLYYWSPQFAYYSQARFQMMPAAGDCDPALAQALAREGILTALCDGSARVLSASVSPQTWGRLCDPVDGQPIDNDEF